MPRRVSPQQILAFNDATNSENRIHSDDVAARYGFRGALVSGVNIYGYLSQPLVNSFGDSWLRAGIQDVMFLKPAFQDELLTIQTELLNGESSERNCVTTACNEQGTLIARLESWLPALMPPANPLADCHCPDQSLPREEIHWDNIAVNQPLPFHSWHPDAEANASHVAVQRDRAHCYRGENAHVHPYFLLDACNKALMRRYIMPAWIHTGSKLILRRPIKVGLDYGVKSIPIDKWERKGHQFIKLYLAFWEGDKLALEVEHTAIFRIAP
jgi:hypothetical protein